jgi:hypothetical protein
MKVIMNIFICKTPYHLLCSELICESFDLTGKKILILAFKISQDESELLISKCWNQVELFNIDKTMLYPINIINVKKWLERHDLTVVKEKEKIRIFLADDKNWLLQVLVASFEASELIIFEDGLGAYVETRQSFCEKVYRKAVLQTLMPGYVFNTNQVNHAKADQYISLSENAFPWVTNNALKKVLNMEDSTYIRSVSKRISKQYSFLNLSGRKCLILLQPLVEHGVCSIEEEKKFYSKVCKEIINTDIVLVKTHHGESESVQKQRIDHIKKNIRSSNQLVILDQKLPAELLIVTDGSIEQIFGMNSTALLNTRRLRPDIEVFYSLQLVNRNYKSMNLFKELEMKGI